MALSTDLLTQFVKVTNDADKTKNDTTAYGRIVVKNESTYVQLDGATDDVLTPVSDDKSYSTMFKDGDRVLVTIKNHKVIVTGNLSRPSLTEAGIADLTNMLSEHNVYIQDLTAKNAVIEEKIEASEADITDLKAKNVTITGELDVVKADVQTLKATSLTAETADLKYATIEKLEAVNTKILNLSATHADFETTTTERLSAVEGIIEDLDVGSAEIGSLRSEMADIKVLMFGSATGDTIQTSFSNAVIAQLGDAQIKSAMIESVSADKITAGDIITNHVRVKSEDGSLLISDETMQISDGNRVRVQIGKDAADDYSINIWDQNGNLMFSKGGITDSAIKEAIIRNDMVSDTANIAAHKLDIDSLFEEINNSSNTIKSTKVYLDDEKQTLDVAFKSLSSTVTEQGKTITSQGTAISVIQGQIENKIWKQDIDTASDSMSTQYSKLSQDLDGVSATVASHTTQLSKKADSSSVTTLNNKVTTLETNLSGFTTTVSETYATKTELASTDAAMDALSSRVAAAETSISQNTQAITLTATKTEVATAKSEAISTASSDATTKANNALSSANANTANLLKDYSTTEEMNAAIQVKADSITSSVSSTYATKSEITSLDARMESAESSITQLSNKITSNVTETTNLGTRMSTVEQTASGLGVRLDTAETNVSTAQSTANTARTEASNAAKTATNYLGLSGTGLVVGDLTTSTLGKNVLIDSDSIDIRNGETLLASFTANEVVLGQNASDSCIDLCDGAGKISTFTSEISTSYPKYNSILIDSQEINTESLRFVANVSNAYGASTTPTITREAELYMIRSSGSGESCARLQAEHTTNSSGAYTKSGFSAMTYDSASSTRALIFASDSASSTYNQVNVYPTKTTYSKPLYRYISGHEYAVFDESMDSGWIDDVTLGDDFVLYATDTNSKVRYRKRGKTVEIRGAVKPSAAITGSTTNYTIFTLPSGYRPDSIVYERCQGSGAYSWLLTVTSSGLVRFARYNDGSQYVSTSTSSWLPFHVTFLVN